MSFLYLNPGYGNLFDEVSQGSYGQSNDTTSATGVRFYACGDRSVHIPKNIKEIWMRFDGYFNGYGGWYPSIYSSTKEVGLGISQNSGTINVTVHGSNKATFNCVGAKWATYLLHAISDATNGLFEVWCDEKLKCSFTGNVLNGEDIVRCKMYSDDSRKSFSQIIISDIPIKWTEKIITIPNTISATMTDNGDGTYSATNSGEYVKQTIDGNALRNSYPDNTVITGICPVGRPAYRDGEGIDTFQAIEGDTVFGESKLSADNTLSIAYGKRVELPVSTISGVYGWKAK